MLPSSLLSYVNAALDTGMAPAAIRGKLVAAGWQEEQADTALQRIVRERAEELPKEAAPLTEDPVPEPPKRITWKPVAIGMAVLLLGAVSGGGGFLLLQSKNPQPLAAASVRPPLASAGPTPTTLLSGTGTGQSPTEDVSQLSDVPLATPLPRTKATARPTFVPTAKSLPTASPTPNATPSPTPSASPSLSPKSSVAPTASPLKL